MFSDPYTSEVLANERRRDLLHEREHDRLVRQALVQGNKYPYLYCRALTQLGRWMVAWGQQLQERYGLAVEAIELSMADQRGDW
jgi:hypothetical protein